MRKDPDEAIRFFLPRFVEAVIFARPLAEELLLQVEAFLGEEESPRFLAAPADLLPKLRAALADAGWFFNEPGEAVGVIPVGWHSHS